MGRHKHFHRWAVDRRRDNYWLHFWYTYMFAGFFIAQTLRSALNLCFITQINLDSLYSVGSVAILG